MVAKQPTPQQAQMFHEAMTGSPLCFHDCCLCRATDRTHELELLIEEVIRKMKAGDFEGAKEDLEKYD